ncbi:hypothetical protein C9374_011262 [Naegleria lovaniensis]|uniref:Uncharacterized protein n=1 Tax=Naegleria lovaniensis TaxID=51637 RepID=A0AA88H3R9_NAELO|nr:uncharacterized protein C9374_011262 [Naegleria lovaniensis]KAG2392537.1 hypothetical protein C9374_011262 [Naegleria lovaniensis]
MSDLHRLAQHLRENFKQCTLLNIVDNDQDVAAFPNDKINNKTATCQLQFSNDPPFNLDIQILPKTENEEHIDMWSLHFFNHDHSNNFTLSFFKLFQIFEPSCDDHENTTTPSKIIIEKKIDENSKQWIHSTTIPLNHVHIHIPMKKTNLLFRLECEIVDLSSIKKNLPKLFREENLTHLKCVCDVIKTNTPNEIRMHFDIQLEKNMEMIEPVLIVDTHSTDKQMSTKFDVQLLVRTDIPGVNTLQLSNVETTDDGNTRGIIVKWKDAFGIPKLVISNAIVTFNVSNKLQLAIECHIATKHHNYIFRGKLSDSMIAIIATRSDPITLQELSHLFCEFMGIEPSDKFQKHNNDIQLSNLTLSISSGDGTIESYKVKKGIMISCQFKFYSLSNLKCSIHLSPENILQVRGTVELNDHFPILNSHLKESMMKLLKGSKLFFEWNVMTPTKISMGAVCKFQFLDTIVMDGRVFFQSTIGVDSLAPKLLVLCGLEHEESLSLYFPNQPMIQTAITNIEKIVKYEKAYFILSTFDYFYDDTSMDLSLKEIDELKIDIKANSLSLILVLDSNNSKWYMLNDKFKRSYQWLTCLISSKLNILHTDSSSPISSTMESTNETSLEKSDHKEISADFETILTIVVGNGRTLLQPAQFGFGVSFNNLKFPVGTRIAFVPLNLSLSVSQNPEVLFQVGVEIIPLNIFTQVTNAILSKLNIESHNMIAKPSQETPTPLLFILEGIVSATDIQLFGKMKGQWNQPFGLQWLTIGDCELGVDLNYAALATTGLPSGVSMQANVTLFNDKKLGMYISMNENILEDFLILKMENFGIQDIMTLAQYVLNIQFESKLATSYEYVRIVKAGISLSAKSMMIRDGFTTMDVATGKKTVKRRKIPMGMTLFSDMVIQLPKILEKSIEGILAAMITPSSGIQYFGKISQFKLWNGNIIVSGFDVENKTLIPVENKKLAENKDVLDFKLLQGLFPSNENENGYTSSQSIEKSPEIYLFIPFNNSQSPKMRVSGMIEFLDMFKFGADLIFAPSTGEVSFMAEIGLAEGIDLLIQFSQTFTGPRLKGKIKGLEKLALLIRHAIKEYKMNNDSTTTHKNNDSTTTHKNMAITTTNFMETNSEQDEKKLRKILEFIKEKIRAERELNMAEKKVEEARRKYSLKIGESISRMNQEISNFTEMGRQIFEQVKDVIMERKVFNKCVDEWHETQKFYEESMEDLDKAIETFKQMLHDYCVKNSQLFKNVNSTLDDISQAVMEKLENLSHDTRNLICDASIHVLELIQVKFSIVDLDFLIVDQDVLALQMTFILGKSDEEKTITLKNINLRKLKNVVADVAFVIISHFTKSYQENTSQSLNSKKEQKEGQDMNQHTARRRGGFCCFRGD